MVGFASHSFFALLTRVSPLALRSSVRLLLCKLPFAKLPRKEPRYVLPPSLGMVLVSTPLDRASDDRPLVVTVISCTVPVLITSVVL